MRATKPLSTFKPAIVDVVTLEQLRELRGAAARYLAKTARVDPSTVSRYETSVVDPKLSTVESSSALGRQENRLEEAQRLQALLALEKMMTHPLIVVESTQQPNKPRAKS